MTICLNIKPLACLHMSGTRSLAARQRLICASHELVEAGQGFRFTRDARYGREVPAFVVRFNGQGIWLFE
jgi:hypothetical protein